MALKALVLLMQSMDLHDTQQQQSSQEECRLGSNIDDVAEAKDMEPDQCNEQL